jgi:hypothetical protein
VYHVLRFFARASHELGRNNGFLYLKCLDAPTMKRSSNTTKSLGEGSRCLDREY